ncbi:hypothetical protein [Parasediminibacterium sp. JCM 36343]|uniref:hypothetical protein n=1 Tax=Parasediminibacterium sp. JCM 36343 TaxID=3374279 RepID=UPI003977F65C
MKKNKLFLGAMALIAMAAPVAMYAQDTAATTTNHTDVVNLIATAAATKWPAVSAVGTGLFIVSEVLGGIPKVRANSVYQLVFGFLKRAFGSR